MWHTQCHTSGNCVPLSNSLGVNNAVDSTLRMVYHVLVYFNDHTQSRRNRAGCVGPHRFLTVRAAHVFGPHGIFNLLNVRPVVVLPVPCLRLSMQFVSKDMTASLSPFDILREFSSRDESRKEQFGKVWGLKTLLWWLMLVDSVCTKNV